MICDVILWKFYAALKVSSITTTTISPPPQFAFSVKKYVIIEFVQLSK